MSATAPAVPYEKQFDMQASRTCGAACLSMVYRSLGQEVPQRLIWPLIAKKNIYGSIASTTHLMAADAVTRGLSAVAIQARHPLQALRVCRDSGIRAILNHRLQPDSPAGHYTVFVDIDEVNVKLHDPYFGPSRRLTHDVFLDLWQPRLPNSEIVGNFLIGVAAESADAPACEVCHTALVKRVQCPRQERRLSRTSRPSRLHEQRMCRSPLELCLLPHLRFDLELHRRAAAVLCRGQYVCSPCLSLRTRRIRCPSPRAYSAFRSGSFELRQTLRRARQVLQSHPHDSRGR